MSNILLLEDDLSLINGLSFAFKKQGFELNIAERSKKRRNCGQTENMICWCWTYLCQMGLALNFAKEFDLHQRCQLFF